MTWIAKQPKILLFNGPDTDSNGLRDILARHTELTSVRSADELFRKLVRDEFDAFLCDWNVSEGKWREVCQQVMSKVPEMPVIAVCRTAGEQEWVEALKAGCFDMLGAPYEESSVLSILEHAFASHEGVLSHRRVA